MLADIMYLHTPIPHALKIEIIENSVLLTCQEYKNNKELGHHVLYLMQAPHTCVIICHISVLVGDELNQLCPKISASNIFGDNELLCELITLPLAVKLDSETTVILCGLGES
jgi:hypothetical protein